MTKCETELVMYAWSMPRVNICKRIQMKTPFFIYVLWLIKAGVDQTISLS